MNFPITISLILIATSIVGLGFFEYQRQNSKNDLLEMKSRFQIYKNQYSLQFKTPQEEEYRLQVFFENLKEIEEHNNNSENSHVVGVNQFSHLTTEEFAAKYLNRPKRPERQSTSSNTRNFLLGASKDHPSSVDWRKKGAVSAVRTQGDCGCCYAITSSGALEGLYFIKTGKLEVFSPQYIVDCSYKKHDNKGCDGGFSQGVFEFVKQNGINLEQRYPYEDKQNKKCKDKQTIKFIQGFSEIPKGDCKELESALANQPVSMSIDASLLKNYKSGVLKQCKKKIDLDHEVLAVGYTPEYFIVKNSWGADWGIDGFFHVSKDNNCGTCDDASYPTL